MLPSKTSGNIFDVAASDIKDIAHASGIYINIQFLEIIPYTYYTAKLLGFANLQQTIIWP